MLTVNCIGAGKVGSTICKLLFEHNIANIQDICNNSLKSSSKAIKFIGSGNVCKNIKEMHRADITFITTPDATIQTIAQKISSYSWLYENDYFIHCSGSLSSEILNPIKKNILASVHPLKSFADCNNAYKTFKGTPCIFEGNENAKKLMQKIFTEIGGVFYTITSTKKDLYHASAVMSANYLVTLTNIAQNMLVECGIEKNESIELLLPLIESSLQNLEIKKNCQAALTGPITRADIKTIKSHIAAIKDENLLKIYKMLGQETIKFADISTENKVLLSTVLE